MLRGASFVVALLVVAASAQAADRRFPMFYEAGLEKIEKIAGGKIEIDRCSRSSAQDALQICHFRPFPVADMRIRVTLEGDPNEPLKAVGAEFSPLRPGDVARARAGNSKDVIAAIVDMATWDDDAAQQLMAYLEASIGQQMVGRYPKNLFVQVYVGGASVTIHVRAQTSY